MTYVINMAQAPELLGALFNAETYSFLNSPLFSEPLQGCCTGLNLRLALFLLAF